MLRARAGYCATTDAGTAVSGGQTAAADGVASDVVRAPAAGKPCGADDDGEDDGEDDAEPAPDDPVERDDLKREKPKTIVRGGCGGVTAALELQRGRARAEPGWW